MSNVDFDFIKAQEGRAITKGYVPDAKGSKSGVTIASGFDLGQRSLDDLKGLPKDIIDILTPFLGYKGAEAEEIASNLEISDDQAEVIDKFSSDEALDKLRRKWQEKTGTSFDELPMHKATPIASVAFQYGDLESKTPNFWRQVTSDDWSAAEKNLRDFGDDYGSRRNREADFFVSGLSDEELDSKKKFDRELEEAKQYGIQEAMLSGEEGDLGSVRTSPRRQPMDVDEFALETKDFLPADKIVNELPITFEDSFISSLGYVREREPYQPRTQTMKRMVDDYERANNTLRKGDYNIYNPEQTRNFVYNEEKRENEITLLDPESYEFDLFTPSFGQTFRAAINQYNVFPSIARYSRMNTDPRFQEEEGYSIYTSEFAKKALPEEALIFYEHARNDLHLKELLKNKYSDLQDLETLAQAPSGLAGSLQFAISMAGPSVIAPIMPIKLLRTTALRRFLQGGVATSLSLGISQQIIAANRDVGDNGQTLQAIIAAGALGGGLVAAFGKGMTDDMILQMRKDQKNLRDNNPLRILLSEGKDPLELDAAGNPVFRDKEGNIIPRSAGAATSPEHARNLAYAQHKFEALEETGIGIETLGWNPYIRLSKSDNPIVRALVPELVYGGGVMQAKVRQLGTAMKQSVEEVFKSRWNSQLSMTVDSMNRQFVKYRTGTASTNPVRNQMTSMGQQIGDVFRPKAGVLTEVQFRHRIAFAMRRGDKDMYNDAATPFVEASAKEMRKLFDDIKVEGQNVRLFEDFLIRDIEAAVKAGNRGLETSLRGKLTELREKGLTLNTALSYVPRVYRVDKIDANPEKFLGILENHFFAKFMSEVTDYEKMAFGKTFMKDTPYKTLEEMARANAKEHAALSMDAITRRKPFLDLEDGQDYLDFLKSPQSAYGRTLEIQDDVLEEFLENDIQALAMHHTKTMGMDIELTRAFGSFDMRYVLDDIVAEHEKMLKAAKNPEERARLNAALQNDLRDVRALRDRLRGTYGASKDPHSMASRSIRMMKSINVLALMGGAVVSSIPDIVRVAMVEGFSHAYSKGFATYFDKQAFNVRRMARKELEQAGVAADATLGLRAHALADTGDMFGSRFALERSVNSGVQTFFTLNFLNPWNHTMKMFAGNVTVLKMTDGIMRKGGWSKLAQAEREKFLKNGISKEDYNLMRAEIKKSGELKYNSHWLPNTEAWSSPRLRMMFRVALNQNVDRMIVTPGAGDRALWTSTEVGSLITQFKSFGQGAAMRLSTAGLQEKDGAFWSGAFLMVALAGIVNEVKRAQYGMTSEESADQKLINAIDRSGILGWFMDANNILEKVTDYNLGMRPTFTNQASYPLHSGAKAGALLGPSANLVQNAGNVVGDLFSGNVDQGTATSLRFMFPTGNIPYLDPIYDGFFDYNAYNLSPNVNRQ